MKNERTSRSHVVAALIWLFFDHRLSSNSLAQLIRLVKPFTAEYDALKDLKLVLLAKRLRVALHLSSSQRKFQRCLALAQCFVRPSTCLEGKKKRKHLAEVSLTSTRQER